jgi:hypothetical protein
MPTWLIIVIAVLALLAIGGAIARRAQLARTRGAFESSLERANHDLAEAAAKDKGWDRPTMEAAAREVFRNEHGADPATLELVEVVDMPGIDEDEAVFRAGHGDHLHEIVLGRVGDQWVRRDPPA